MDSASAPPQMIVPPEYLPATLDADLPRNSVSSIVIEQRTCPPSDKPWTRYNHWPPTSGVVGARLSLHAATVMHASTAIISRFMVPPRKDVKRRRAVHGSRIPRVFDLDCRHATSRDVVDARNRRSTSSGDTYAATMYETSSPPTRCYSARIASAGSTFAARSAGTEDASIATAASTRVTSTYVIGSVDFVLNSSARMSCVSAIAPTTPIPRPTATMVTPSLTTIRITRDGDAPSAIRMPISRDRCPTRYAITP